MKLSLDISTSCTGYSVFDDNGKLMEINYVKLTSKLLDGMFSKFNFFKESINHLLKLPITRIVIEKPLEKMQGKHSSSHTIAVLNFFNGMISSYLYHAFNVEPIYYEVKHARAIVFPGIQSNEKDSTTIKHKLWERVMQMEPQVNWKYSKTTGLLITENYDMVDSYVVGVADFIVMKKQIEKESKK